MSARFRLQNLLLLGLVVASNQVRADESVDHAAVPPAAGVASKKIAAETAELGWKSYKIKRGIEVFRRPVEGSKFYEYRAEIHSPLSPEKIIDEMWRKAIVGRSPLVKYRQILKELPNEIVLYDQIKTPVVSDRDYTLQLRKIDEPATHRYAMTFETANQLGPPVDRKHVRISRIRGAWSVELDEKGGSRLRYRSFSEPGGSIPAFLIHGVQFDQVIWDVERIIDQLQHISTP